MKNNKEAGFSIIDVICAIFIMTIGILALLSALSGSVVQSKGQEFQLTAKQLVASTLESIMSVKETNRNGLLGWKAVGNIGSNPDGSGGFTGIFLNGFQPVKLDAGPDQILGTADDTGAVVDGYQRKIEITDQCDVDRPSPNCPTPGTFGVRIRTVKVTVTYYVGSALREESVTTVLTDYEAATN